MANRLLKRVFHDFYFAKSFIERREGAYRRFVYGVLNRSQSQLSKSDKFDVEKKGDSCGDEDFRESKWKLELAWLTKALEPALHLCRWALPSGSGVGNTIAPSSRSVSDIISSIQWSKIGIEGWSLSDLTIGLYLIYLRQASLNPFEDIKGVQISSESIVHDLIYHTELAKGCYKGDTSGLARNTLLRESNIVKFVKDSSVMRPGYYIGIDPRRKLVILGIRGTHTVYDLITGIVSSSDEEVSFEGYSTHFGMAEAARWFLTHEMGTIRECLEKYEGFRLRLVGHSLGGATASLLAIMLRKTSPKELGFSPDIVSAVAYATPPCVSRELAESCCDYVTTVVMQDDIIPRLSAASLARLRNEILQTDWMSVIQQEDWKSVVGLVTNAKQVVSSVQDVARKLADYAHLQGKKISPRHTTGKKSVIIPEIPLPSKATAEKAVTLKREAAAYTVPEELFVPGTVYYLKRDIDTETGRNNGRGIEYFTLWKRHPGEHFQRIVLSSNIYADHKCDSHYHALRDVLKGLPGKNNECILQ